MSASPVSHASIVPSSSTPHASSSSSSSTPHASSSSSSSTPVATHFHLTGFGEFHGVRQNPTKELMETLPAYLEKHPLPENVRIDGCTVLETSGVGSLETLKTLKHSNITSSAAPSSASPAAATSSAPASSFTPSHTATCNTQADFARIRSELRAYGVDRFQADMIHAGWFVRTEAGQVELATEGPKFNPYAKLVSGKLAAPYGNLLAQHSLHSADAQFFVAQNRPELDAAWASSEPDMVGKASMAQRHQFLLVKSLSWEVFNVAAFGINGDVQSLKQAIKLLDDMQETAIQYTRKAGWSSSLGLFFHCFPLNSVQALHLHMIDMEVRGPTFANLEYKNLPLEAVRAQLVEELAAVESKQQQRKHRSVYLHFGVHDGSQTFKVESTAYNCADFRVPDQRNWQPRNALIQPQCPAEVKTELDVHSIVKHLTKPKQDGAEGAWKCIVSEDPGRFVCNWVFYQSLRQSSSLGTHSLFVHVPSHQVYDLAAQQQFATEVIRAVVDELDRQEAGGEKTSKVASSTTTSDSAHSNPDEQLRR